jgi:hypothetical protein
MNELFSVSQDGLRTGSGTKSAPQTRAASLREAPEADSHQDGYAYSFLPPSPLLCCGPGLGYCSTVALGIRQKWPAALP